MFFAILGAALGAAAQIYGAYKAGKTAAAQAEEARKQQAKLAEAQEKIRVAIDEYYGPGGKGEEYYKAMDMLNGQYDENTAKRISQLTESLNAANDAFSIDSQSAIDNYINGVDTMLANYNGDMAAAIQTFSGTVNESIRETATKNLQQINMTKQEVDALIDQFSADSSANIANFTKESGMATGEMEASLNNMIAEYDASQAGRNQALDAALGNASEGFRQAVQKEAAVRDKIIGDNLKLTGQVLANTNEGVSQILGVTPEENLQKAQAAATDFATAYAESAGTAAGNQAQQAARQSGMTKGAAALMGTTAASNATNQQFNQAAATGLNAYQGAQAAQVKALEEQYARQRELSQAQMDEARKSETQNTANADKIAQLESENAKMQAQMSQQDELEKARQQQQTAETVSGAKREDATKAAEMEADKAQKELDSKTANEKEAGAAVMDANSTANTQLQTAAKDVLISKEKAIETARQTQENALNNVRQDSKDKAQQELTNSTNTASTISNKQKEADNASYQHQAQIEQDKRADALGKIDTEMNITNQQAGISGNASNLAANAQNNFGNQIGSLGNSMIGAGAGLADVAGAKPKEESAAPEEPKSYLAKQWEDQK
jgi:hypothetical protein